VGALQNCCGGVGTINRRGLIALGGYLSPRDNREEMLDCKNVRNGVNTLGGEGTQTQKRKKYGVRAHRRIPVTWL